MGTGSQVPTMVTSSLGHPYVGGLGANLHLSCWGYLRLNYFTQVLISDPTFGEKTNFNTQVYKGMGIKMVSAVLFKSLKIQVNPNIHQ